jgi:hypothetical protein
MIWALAVLGLGIASIWLGVLSLGTFRQALESDPKSAISWDVILSAILHGDTSSTYGPKLILLGFVFVAIAAVFLITGLIDLFV